MTIVKRILCTLCFWVVLHATAFSGVKYPFQKELKKQDFNNVKSQVEQILANDSLNCKANYTAYLLYSDSAFAQCNLPVAYHYLENSQRGRKREQKVLEKDGFTNELYQQEFSRLGEMLWKATLRENTISAYESFLAYKKLPARQKSRCKKLLYELAYSEAMNVETEEAYSQYIKDYPKSPYREKVELLLSELQAGVSKQQDWRDYCSQLESKTADNAVQKAAAEKMLAILKTTNDVEGLQYAVEKFTGEHREECIRMLHHIYEEHYSFLDVYKFHDRYKFPDSETYKRLLSKDRLALTKYTDYLNHPSRQTIEAFIRAAAPYYCAYQHLLILLKPQIDARRWNEALQNAKQFEQEFSEDKRYSSLLIILSADADDSVQPRPVAGGINTLEGNEYVPQLSGDGQTMMFCGRGRTDSVGYEDVYISRRVEDGQWGKARPVSELCDAWNNDAPVSISVDGNHLILFVNGKLCESERTKNGWSRPKPMSSNINISPWQADAMITADGSALLFAARKPTKRELENPLTGISRDDKIHQSNIYVSFRQADGSWGKAVELGGTINTPLCDRAPFLHPDMKTLYFCSAGHGGLGGMDVYKSIRLREDSWVEWSEPVNLGKQINTSADDCWYVISTDGSTAYYSAFTNQSGFDIYEVRLPEKARPEKVMTVKGRLTDTEGNPVEAKIFWEDLEEHKIIGESKTNPTDGSFFIALPYGKVYGYYTQKDGFFPVSSSVDLRSDNDSTKEVECNLTVVSFQQMQEKDIPVVLNNLFFETAKWDLLPESENELQRVAALLQQLDKKVLIAGHTDNVGTAAANQILSENRAKAVYDYLINAGCKQQLLSWAGYGETRPVTDNSTVEGRKYNRRVEIHFVKK